MMKLCWWSWCLKVEIFICKEFDKGKKTKVTKKIKPKPAKAKTTKRAPAKKAPAKKRTTKLTATDRVLKIINRSKKGVDAPTLVRKTGFDAKKIRNILHRVYKEGKVKRVGRGIYMSA
jgi:predicted Rossmann fold nucleotide-binding protein DprA/Smf involved in DNA uptake